MSWHSLHLSEHNCLNLPKGHSQFRSHSLKPLKIHSTPGHVKNLDYLYGRKSYQQGFKFNQNSVSMTYDWILLLRVQSSQIVLNVQTGDDQGFPSLGWTQVKPVRISTTYSFYVNIHSLILHLDIQWLIKFNISQTVLQHFKSAPPHITPASSDWHHWLTDAYGRKLGIILLLLSPALGSITQFCQFYFQNISGNIFFPFISIMTALVLV